MTLLEILNIANAEYPDAYLDEYYDTTTGRRKQNGQGDTLSQFIVIELSETYDEAANDAWQLMEAARVLRIAMLELQRLVRAFEEKAGHYT